MGGRTAGGKRSGKKGPQKGRVWVGCSGWEYRHWRGNFYPEAVPRKQWFEHYCSVFDTVEINNSFYRLPQISTVKNWHDRSPDEFVFAMKASRYLTHMKKLKHPEDPLRRLFSRARPLGRKLSVVLYQLPPSWRANPERLEAFLNALPRGVRHAVEFREATWYDDDIYAALERHGVAMCLHDMPGSASPRVAVGPFVYLRFHGAESKYAGGYPAHVLEQWAAWAAEQRRAGRDLYAYFNNDVGGHAPRDARTLRDLLL